jgi:hypothetical protein
MMAIITRPIYPTDVGGQPPGWSCRMGSKCKAETKSSPPQVEASPSMPGTNDTVGGNHYRQRAFARDARFSAPHGGFALNGN